MKILMLVDDLNIGGTATHVLSICKELLNNNFEVLVISRIGELDYKFKEINIEVMYLDLNKDLKNISLEIIKIINKNKVNLIHTHLIRSIEIANYIKKLTNINFISTLHILFYDKKILNLLINSNHIICVSEPIKEILIQISDYDLSKKISVIYNSIKIKESVSLVNVQKETKNLNDDYKIITYCSRLKSAKGVVGELFINEFYKLAKDDDKLIAFILGDGDRKRNIDFYCNHINNTLKRKAIYVLGSIENPDDYFKISHCVVGTGRVIIEAINLSINCIAFGSSGFVGIVEPANYKIMLNTYFGEHKKSQAQNKNLNQSIKEILYSNSMKNIPYLNKLWCSENFNEEINILKLINIYTSSL
ncbi:MAG: glycosyltransferase [Romboutsia sp.]|uniref:glycosyltransferase n=1 Tax=Romboutsia sp. TaxID=1965302 RepID=UPI003F3FB035